MIVITSELLTHVPLIDEQHQELFNRINAAAAVGNMAKVRQEALETLDFLGKYIVKHFTEEEELMLKSGYPSREWHHTWHQGYIAKFDSMQKEFMQNGASQEYMEILQKFIMDWIVKHIMHVDVELGKHIIAWERSKK
jgi:hemerythrin